jgi:hypothetical protein
LRNTIYAIGLRAAESMSGQSSTFSKARSRSWPYFENALSVQTELVYAKSGVTEIQTLALMVSDHVDRLQKNGRKKHGARDYISD